MSIGEKLKTIRNTKGISQKELSKLINSHINDISRYERGVQIPSIEVIKKIAQVFDVSTDFLLFDNYQEISSKDIKDKILINYFKRVSKLPEKEKNLIIEIIDAILLKSDLNKTS
jgi:transcriptional regulator with XRE-family HTH domain